MQMQQSIQDEMDEIKSKRKTRFHYAKEKVETDGSITLYSDCFLELTSLQRKIVEHLLGHPDASLLEASKAAGKKAAVKLTPKMRKCLALYGQRRRKEHKLSEKFVIDNLMGVVKQGRAAIPVIDEKGVETGEYKANLGAANDALEKLGRYLGLWGRLAEIAAEAEQQAKAPQAQIVVNVADIMREINQRKRAEIGDAKPIVVVQQTQGEIDAIEQQSVQDVLSPVLEVKEPVGEVSDPGLHRDGDGL